MKQTLVLLLLFTGFQLNAQTGKFVGQVTDEKGEALVGAAVIYKKDVTIGSITDEIGAFSLELPNGEARIVCRFSGMITDTFHVTIISGKTITRDIVMKPYIDPDVQDIGDVVVRVGKFDKRLEDQTVSMETFKA